MTAAKLGTTQGAVKVTAHWMRQRYRKLLREETAHTLASRVELNEGIHHLFEAFP
jgi:RNA polymerase sigma-70 factor (ECF subfamily)